MLRTDIKPRIASDKRGKIKTGMKSENGYPKSLSYFNIENFPELLRAYGEKPDKLIVFFPSNNIEDFYRTEYNSYGSNLAKKRTCDGQNCIHHISETINGKKYEAGQESPCCCKDNPNEKELCSCYMSLKAYIAGMDGILINPICYYFESHSANTADNLYTEILKTWQMFGGKLIGLPFMLWVDMVAGKSANQKFPIWNIQPIGTISQLQLMANNSVIPTNEINRNVIDLTGQAPAIQERTETVSESEIAELRELANQKKAKMNKEQVESLRLFLTGTITRAGLVDWQDTLGNL
jgi:hypothetical protein